MPYRAEAMPRSPFHQDPRLAPLPPSSQPEKRSRDPRRLVGNETPLHRWWEDG